MMVFQLLLYFSHTYFSFSSESLPVESSASDACLTSIDDLIRQQYYIFDRLIESETPALFAHFKAFNVSPVLFSTTWFETLFARTFSIRHLSQIWDFLLFREQKHHLFAIGLALLKLEAPNLLKQQGFETLIASCKSLGVKIVDIKALLKIAASYSLSIEDQVKQFAQDWAHPLTEKQYLCF